MASIEEILIHNRTHSFIHSWSEYATHSMDIVLKFAKNFHLQTICGKSNPKTSLYVCLFVYSISDFTVYGIRKLLISNQK